MFHQKNFYDTFMWVSCIYVLLLGCLVWSTLYSWLVRKSSPPFWDPPSFYKSRLLHLYWPTRIVKLLADSFSLIINNSKLNVSKKNWIVERLFAKCLFLVIPQQNLAQCFHYMENQSIDLFLYNSNTGE